MKEWVEALDEGKFEAKDIDTQMDAGWKSWFCEEKALPAKTIKLGKIVKYFMNLDIVDPTKVYIFFKNNNPIQGKFHDTLYICSIEQGNVLFAITPHSGYDDTKGWTLMFTPLNDFKESYMESKTGWKYFKIMLKNEKDKLKKQITEFLN